MDEIIQQFFSMTSLRLVKFEDWKYQLQDESQQIKFLSKVLQSNHARLFPVSRKYKKNFLKKLISEIECSGIEVMEELYMEYMSLLQNKPCEDFCYKTHYFPPGHRIIMREATSMLSSGTTGLVSWQAAFAMCEFVNSNVPLFTAKRIFELGCGSGFLGIFICKVTLPLAYTFTDSHEKVLDFLGKNLLINNLLQNDYSDNVPSDVYDEKCDEEFKLSNNCWRNNSDSSYKNMNTAAIREPSVLDCDCCFIHQNSSNHKPSIGVEKMDWVNFQCSEYLEKQNFDVIIGSDLVFDCSIIPSLANILAFLLKKSENVKAFIATTIRNEETYKCFTMCLDEHDVHWSVVGSTDAAQLFMYDKSVKIEILEIVQR